MDPASMQKGDMMDVGEERAATQAKLPVIYHQCLLMFAERYRNDITEDQREALLDLLLTQYVYSNNHLHDFKTNNLPAATTRLARKSEESCWPVEAEESSWSRKAQHSTMMTP